jgi:hypothetical protein
MVGQVFEGTSAMVTCLVWPLFSGRVAAVYEKLMIFVDSFDSHSFIFQVIMIIDVKV